MQYILRFGRVAFTLSRLVESVTSNLNTKYQLNRVEDFIKRTPNLGIASDAFKQSLENIKTNIRWIETNKNNINTWLLNNFVQSNTSTTATQTTTTMTTTTSQSEFTETSF